MLRTATAILLMTLTLLTSIQISAEEPAKPEKLCMEMTEAGFICPRSLDNPVWKAVCKNGCFLLHPDQKKLDWVNAQKAKLIPELQLQIEELQLQRDEAKDQRDRALEDSLQFENLWKKQVKVTNHWKTQAEEAYGFWEMAGAAGGGFLLGGVVTTGLVLLFMFGI